MNNFNGIKFYAEGTLYHSLLRKHFFYIPDYQREYSWQKKHIEELLIDLESSEKQNKSHFIGAVVLSGTKDDEKVNIIDGQQRLITISLLSTALRNLAYYISTSEEKTEEKKHELMTACKFILSREDEFSRKNLIQIDRNSNEYYSNIINFNHLSTENLRNEEKLLLKNYDIIFKFFKDNIDKYADINLKLEYISKLINVIKNISIIPIYVNDDYDAYTIFEVLNDRGLDLNLSDLLKNLLFKKSSSDNKEQIKKLWEEMLIILENSKINITQFIRHYWISREKFVREKDLYESIKLKISGYNDQKLTDFLSDLLNNAKNYKSIYTPELENFKGIKNGKRIFTTLNYIDNLNVKQCYPIVLSLYNRYLKGDIDGIKLSYYLEKIEKFSFIYIRTDLSPSKIEGIYSEYAINVLKNEKNLIDSEINNLVDELNNVLINVDLKKVFDRIIYVKDGNNKLINYVLQRLELGENIEFTVNGNTIEHIYSKSNDSIEKYKNENGISELEKENAIYDLNKIGNLTLLSGEDNELIGDDDFSKKVEIYKKSKVIITNSLGNYSSWSKKDIDSRHNELYEKFTLIFNL